MAGLGKLIFGVWVSIALFVLGGIGLSDDATAMRHRKMAGFIVGVGTFRAVLASITNNSRSTSILIDMHHAKATRVKLVS